MWLAAHWPGLLRHGDTQAREKALSEEDAAWLAAEWPGLLRHGDPQVSAPALPAFPAWHTHPQGSGCLQRLLEGGCQEQQRPAKVR